MSNKAQEISVLQYPILNGMRGVAAIVVLCGHYALISGRNYFPSYYLAVDFFFLLSGFVISNAYQAKIDNSLSKFEFLILRIIRLTPLFLLGIFLGLLQFVIISEHGGAYSRAKLIFSMCFNVFYMPAPSSLSITPYLNFPLNSPAWSLSFEMWACVLFAFIAPKTRSLALACLAALGLIGLCFFSMKAHTANIGWSPATLGGGAFRMLFSFVVGMILNRHIKRFAKLPKLPAPVLYLLLLLSFLTPKEWGSVGGIVNITLVYPIILILTTRSGISIAGGKIANWLGDVSYPFYIIHYPLLHILVFFLKKEYFDLFITELSVGIIFVILSWFLDKYFDKPVRRKIQSTLSRLRKAIDIKKLPCEGAPP